MPGTSGKFANLLPPGLGTGKEKPQNCRMPPSKSSPSESSQLSPLVSSDTLTPLVYYARKLIALVHCANVLRNLKIGTQFPDSENVWHNLKIVQIPKLCRTYTCIAVCICKAEGCQKEIVSTKELCTVYMKCPWVRPPLEVATQIT